MIKYFHKAFKITNDNIILTTPLVLFLFLLSIYIGVAQNAPSNTSSFILLSATILFMLSAFFAGWFYMVREAIKLDKKEFDIEEAKAKASFALIKQIPMGIGEYFLYFVGALILYSILFLLISVIAYYLGIHFIGKIDVDLNKLKIALNSTIAMKSLIASLSHEQIMRLNNWYFLFMGFLSFFSFITMYWGAEIIFRTKNPIMAFFRSLGFLFKRILQSLILFIYISFINFLISLINTFAMMNSLLYFIAMVIYFYFLVYVVVLIFLYYDSESNGQIKYKYPDGSQQDNSDSGADSHWEKQSGDTDSSED